MKVDLDSEADAVYISFSDKEVDNTRRIDKRTILDVDEEGEIIGIELLEFSNRFNSISELNIDFGEAKAKI